MLGKILLISSKYPLLYLTGLVKILVLRKALYCLRHTAYEIVLLERVDVGLLKARDHLMIPLVEQFRETLLSGGHQKFLERERVQLQEVHFAHWKGGAFMQGNTQQRTRAYNVIFGSVFVKVLERAERSRHLLHLIKNQKRMIGIDFLTGI